MFAPLGTHHCKKALANASAIFMSIGYKIDEFAFLIDRFELLDSSVEYLAARDVIFFAVRKVMLLL